MKLLTPALANEVADHHRLVELAGERLPLDELDCIADGNFTNPETDLYFEYRAPEGRAIRVTGGLTISGADRYGNPYAYSEREFVGYALVYQIRNLRLGGSVHKQNRDNEASPGQVIKYVHPFDDGRKSDRPRPRLEVTVVGRPEVSVTLGSSAVRYFETGQRRFGYSAYSQAYDIEVETADGDITDLEVEVIDDPCPPDIQIPDMSFYDEVMDSLWLPHAVNGVLSAEALVQGLINRGEIDPDDQDTIERYKSFFWRDYKYSRGTALSDDPYPDSALLRLASTIDSEGNNARLYGPYEGTNANSDMGTLLMPDGTERVVRIMSRDELLRRISITHDLQRTGWSVTGGRE